MKRRGKTGLAGTRRAPSVRSEPAPAQPDTRRKRKNDWANHDKSSRRKRRKVRHDSKDPASSQLPPLKNQTTPGSPFGQPQQDDYTGERCHATEYNRDEVTQGPQSEPEDKLCPPATKLPDDEEPILPRTEGLLSTQHQQTNPPEEEGEEEFSSCRFLTPWESDSSSSRTLIPSSVTMQDADRTPPPPPTPAQRPRKNENEV